MNGTPRLRSAYPSTPRKNTGAQGVSDNVRRSYPSSQGSYTSSPKPTPLVRSLRASAGANPPEETLIPLNVVDGPSQRLYAAAFYAALTAWRFYDYWSVSDDLDSTWLFLKWISIDAVFLFSLPNFRIPWLQWSFSTSLTAWLLHAIANAFLMYHIPIPIGAMLSGMLKVAYDRELSISEHRVKPADIIHNSSIILGKQIIHILPEGSAVLNPDRLAFCLDHKTTSVDLPIRINQTNPILIEILRFDLDTNENETITINAKQARRLKRQADKEHPKSDTANPRMLWYPTSKKGLYQLQRVIDESKLEVRRQTVDTLIAACPYAVMSTDNGNKCSGDLSNISLNVTGVPPFKVRYSRRINKQQSSSNVQSIQPPGLESPLSVDQPSTILVDPRKPQLDWARPMTIVVPINESLNLNGTWSYNVEAVEDGFGNTVFYDADLNGLVTKGNAQQQRITVHHRPSVFLHGCDAQTFLRVAKEDSATLPVRLRLGAQLSKNDWPLTLDYSFVPENSAGMPSTDWYSYELVNERSLPRITRAGKYNLESIRSQYCPGEITEPSSCLLFNPPEPDMKMTHERISDKCAGSSIGLAVDLDFTGTPPFRVRYSISHHGNVELHVGEFQGLRGHLDFKPSQAGSYVYEFLEIQDDVYDGLSLRGKNLILTQDVKPPASATFVHSAESIKACLDQALSVNVKLLGDAPWTLEYDLRHGGKSKSFKVKSANELYSIETPPLSVGGQHSLVLTNIVDKAGCRQSIREELIVEVRPEQSRASFGDIEGRRSILALEGKLIKLPLRLKGIAPWTVQIANLDDAVFPVIELVLQDANAVVPVTRPGTYEILSVHDTCPGIVDSMAKTFTVSWIGRPTLSIKDSMVSTEGQEIYRKASICENDDDVLRMIMTGNPPYHIKYQEKSQPLKGPAAISNKALSAAIGSASVQMDSSHAGDYTYTFTELSDDRYGPDRKNFSPMIVRQKVHSLPGARFASPGKTYGYCKDEGGDTEDIPITLEGAPPFSLEIGITHHGSSKPDLVRVKDIMSTSYSWSLLRRGLDLGTHSVSIRKVQDSRGCEKDMDDDPSSVRIMVSDPPTIIPLESQTDYCVGERVSYSLSGQPPFQVFYRFQGQERKAAAPSTTFRRIAEQPGEFTITGISDNASGKCKAEKNITKHIHPMPSVKVSKGMTSVVDIHEGGEAEILFDFTGTPPFEFTYTRSENAKRGKKAAVLETRTDKSYAFSKTIRASDEGTYEVVAIKDKYCAFSVQKPGGRDNKSQKMLQQ